MRHYGEGFEKRREKWFKTFVHRMFSVFEIAVVRAIAGHFPLFSTCFHSGSQGHACQGFLLPVLGLSHLCTFFPHLLAGLAAILTHLLVGPVLTTVLSTYQVAYFRFLIMKGPPREAMFLNNHFLLEF